LTLLRPLLLAGAILAAVFGGLVAKVPSAAAADAEFVEESALVPVRVGSETIRLEMLFVRPRGLEGRLPVALINHGKPSSRAEMAAVHATNYRAVAQDFARRGWLAAAVIRRGYGLSEGVFQSAGNCKAGHDLMAQFRAEATDLAGALAVISARRDADPGRIMALGVSDGGVAALALASNAPPGLKAVINISGGLRNKECPFEDQLVDAFRELGTKPTVPSLWLYAENDTYFPPLTAERLRDAYREGGTTVSFVMLPPVGEDGHRLFTLIEGRVRWWPEVDRFLRAQGLPTWPAGLADQLMQGLKLDPKHKGTIERYVSAPGEKALVKGANGLAVYWWAGADNAEDAARKALAACAEKKALPCQLVLANQAAAPAGLAGGKP
jgi:dienelactone hydrolase